MKIVADTNIVIAGLIKDSTVRKILANENISFFSPDFVIDEVIKHRDYIIQKSELLEEDFDILFALVIDNVKIIPKEEYNSFEKTALELIKDKDDVPFFSLALAINADGIWSNDKQFLAQNKIRIFSTKDMISLM
jgi:predicted nucleic acid-binding protein